MDKARAREAIRNILGDRETKEDIEYLRQLTKKEMSEAFDSMTVIVTEIVDGQIRVSKIH